MNAKQTEATLEVIKKSLLSIVAEEFEIICVRLIKEEYLTASDLYKWNTRQAMSHQVWVEFVMETYNPSFIIKQIGGILADQGYRVTPPLKVKVGVPFTMYDLGAAERIPVEIYEKFGSENVEVEVGMGDDQITSFFDINDDNQSLEVQNCIDRAIVMIATMVLDADDDELDGLSNFQVGLLKDYASSSCPFDIVKRA